MTYAYGTTGGYVYHQNTTWDTWSEINYDVRDLVVPGSSFALTFTTNTYVGTYGGGGNADIAFTGNSSGGYMFAVVPEMEQAPVPEPSSLLALGSGMFVLGGLIRRRR